MIDFGAPIEIIKTTRRKTATIKIEGGNIKLIVPFDISSDKIDNILNDKKDWISQKLRLQSKQNIASPKQFISGEAFTYLDRNYRLKIIREDASALSLKGGYLVVGVNGEWSEGECEVHIRLELSKWFREQSMKRIKSKVKKYSEIIGKKPKSIKVQKLENRWGSCSPDGDIIFNWRIISAPHSVIDYVVVHELCHLLEHNHSENFWNHVSRIIPDYKKHKEWLKYNGESLGLI